MREALERYDPNRKRVLVPLHDNVYRDKFLEAGTNLLNQRGVPHLLEEVADLIRPTSPDVVVKNPLLAEDGTVRMAVEWNRQEKGNSYECEAIWVTARPLTGAFVVHGQEQELVEHWRRVSDKNLLADAIAEAYKTPCIMADQFRWIVLYGSEFD